MSKSAKKASPTGRVDVAGGIAKQMAAVHKGGAHRVGKKSTRFSGADRRGALRGDH